MKLISDKLLKNIVDNIEITEILSAKHISYITDIVYEEAFKYIKSEHKISVLLTDIYHQNNSLIIKDIIDEATETKIKTNIEEFIINSLEKILTDKEKLSNMMGKIYDVINIDEIINNRIENRKLSQRNQRNGQHHQNTQNQHSRVSDYTCILYNYTAETWGNSCKIIHIFLCTVETFLWISDLQKTYPLFRQNYPQVHENEKIPKFRTHYTFSTECSPLLLLLKYTIHSYKKIYRIRSMYQTSDIEPDRYTTHPYIHHYP